MSVHPAYFRAIAKNLSGRFFISEEGVGDGEGCDKCLLEVCPVSFPLSRMQVETSEILVLPAGHWKKMYCVSFRKLTKQ